MSDLATTERRGAWAYLAGQPRSLSNLLSPLAVGFVGAFVTGATVGFGENDDAVVGQVRIAAPLVTGLVAGLVGRGLWGWILVSVGATAGMAPFMLSERDLATSLFGGFLLSLPVLAPGYGLARLLAFAKVMLQRDPRGRSAVLRVPLRRLLRAGVLLSGGLSVVVIQATSVLSGQRDELMVPTYAALGGILCASYLLYRLIDRLDRGERRAAIPFTLVFGPIGFLAAGAIAANRQPDVAWISTLISLAVVLIPILFMAFGPWYLVRIVQAQGSPTAWPSTLPTPTAAGWQQPQAVPAPWQPWSTPVSPTAPPPARDVRLILVGLVALACLAIVAVWVIGTQGGATEPAPGPAALSHEAPEVEALLPASVAGRPLAAWSVRGESAFRLWGMTPDEVQAASETLASEGIELDDVVQATAGRSDTGTDPPYFVLAFHIPEAARDLLGGYAIRSAGFTRDTQKWQLVDRLVGDRRVSVGPTDLLVQNEHQRGRPYLYGSTALDTSFIVITDDDAWAAEAISQLPE
jgi:hypothetical protein